MVQKDEENSEADFMVVSGCKGSMSLVWCWSFESSVVYESSVVLVGYIKLYISAWRAER